MDSLVSLLGLYIKLHHLQHTQNFETKPTCKTEEKEKKKKKLFLFLILEWEGVSGTGAGLDRQSRVSSPAVFF